MTDLLHQLDAAARAFRLETFNLVSPVNDREIALRIVPPRNPTQAVNSVIETLGPLTGMKLKLEWRFKDVLFARTPIEDNEVSGGLPIGTSPTPTAGVPGQIGIIEGTYAPVELEPETHERRYSIARIHIAIKDETGRPTELGYWSTSASSGFVAVNSDHVVLTAAAETAAALSGIYLVLPPVFVDQRADAVTIAHRTVHVSIVLNVDTTRTSEIDLPPLPVTIPTIQIPALLCLFEHERFSGRIGVFLPGSSLIEPEAASGMNIGGVLNTLVTALQAITPPGVSPLPHPLVQFLASGPGMVITSLRPEEGQVIVLKADRIANFDEFVFAPGFFGFGRATCEDIFTSLVFIGAPGQRVRLFNTRDYISSEGELTVTLGTELYTSVSTLAVRIPVSDNPPNRVNVPITPSGSRFSLTGIATFSEQLSSLLYDG